MIAATLTPLAAGNSEVLLSLSVVLAIFTGLFCFAASVLRLGFLADFLSRPILTGFLNGVAISIFLGQIGKVFGFAMQSHGIIANLIEFVRKVPETHLPTLAVGLLAIAVMLVSKRLLPRWPGPLLAVVAAVAVVKTMGLDAAGVAVVGNVPAGLPRFHWPTFDPQFLPPLFGGALGVALVSFCNAMVVAQELCGEESLRSGCGSRALRLGREPTRRRPVPRLRRERHRVADGDEPRHGRQEPGCGIGGGRSHGGRAAVPDGSLELSAEGGAGRRIDLCSHRAVRPRLAAAALAREPVGVRRCHRDHGGSHCAGRVGGHRDGGQRWPCSFS